MTQLPGAVADAAPGSSDPVTAAFWRSERHPRGKDGRFISIGDIVSGGGVTGRVTGMRGDKVTVRNPVTGQSREVRAKELTPIQAQLPRSLQPSSPSPKPPAAAPAPSSALPERQTGDRLTRGDVFSARDTVTGDQLEITIDGISRRADGGYTVLATDSQGKPRRIVLSPTDTVQPVRKREPVAASLLAAPEPGERIESDYYRGGFKKKGKGGGRKVASKAGEKRYGLPIGTPLGGTRSQNKADTQTQVSYDTFMAASTPADLRKAASWLSNDDLGRAAEALFSFDSDNERDQAGRIALVRELADRGIDPRQFGYRGTAVVLNPNPKEDPTVKAAKAAARLAEQEAAKKDRAAKKDAAAQESDAKAQAATAKRLEVEAQAKAAAEARDAVVKKIGDDIASGNTKPKDLVRRS